MKYCAIFWLAAALPATETAGYCIVSVLPFGFRVYGLLRVLHRRRGRGEG